MWRVTIAGVSDLMKAAVAAFVTTRNKSSVATLNDVFTRVSATLYREINVIIIAKHMR